MISDTVSGLPGDAVSRSQLVCKPRTGVQVVAKHFVDLATRNLVMRHGVDALGDVPKASEGKTCRILDLPPQMRRFADKRTTAVVDCRWARVWTWTRKRRCGHGTPN